MIISPKPGAIITYLGWLISPRLLLARNYDLKPGLRKIGRDVRHKKTTVALVVCAAKALKEFPRKLN